jgi:predicted ribosomally synthesized peptide with SipW-like signal peptide
MNRRLLVSLIALGSVVTLIGGAGIFAVFTDRATTGTNSVTSGEMASAADLLIAQGVAPAGCGAFVDDLVTGLFSITDAQPGAGSLGQANICLKNAGSADLAYSVAAIDLVDVETDCTGDEAESGDATCGIGPLGELGVGELSPLILADIMQTDCTTGSPNGIGLTNSLADLEGGGSLGMSAAPNAVVCLRIDMRYPPGITDTAAQIAQTDQVTWRFAFDATTF